MKINFITTNRGKQNWLKADFKSLGEEIEIKSPFVKIIEPQADTFHEVSVSKAMQAFHALNEPIVVEDGGFCIPALNGFPGVYSKYINQTLGNEGLLRLIEGKNRDAYFTTVTTFTDGEVTKSFERRLNGLIPENDTMIDSPLAWSNLWRIFIPEGHEKTLSEMNEKELFDYQTGKNVKQSSLCQFAKWYLDYIKL